MQSVPEPVTSLSIARHAAQFILYTAANTAPDRCCGIIGLNNTLITRAFALPNRASDTLHHCEIGAHPAVEDSTIRDLRHMADQWSESDTVLSGTFFTAKGDVTPAISEITRLEAALKQAIPELTTTPITHLALVLNTAGCLEAFAYQIHHNALVSIPLMLEEDGQQHKNG